MTTPNVSGNGEVSKRGIRALSALSGNRGKSGHPLAVLWRPIRERKRRLHPPQTG
jgi:hypothetical protein